MYSPLEIWESNSGGGKLKNGDFEKGNFSKWQKISNGGGQWHLYTPEDKASPIESAFGFAVASSPAPRGEYSPTLSQDAPSSNALHRKVRVPMRAKSLSGYFYWGSKSEDWTWTGNFEFNGPANEYFVLDLIKGGADPFTTKSGKVLEEIFRPSTEPGVTPADSEGWQKFKVGLGPYRGKSVQIRLAEVDNQGPLAVGIDDLKLKKKR